GVIPHLKEELQFAASLTDGSAESGAHAVITSIEHQHRALPLTCFSAFRDYCPYTREPANGLIIIDHIGV
ncbi:MAG TPA: hypothetical protein DCE18_14380, partial [Syntrophobacteraceae bacterium]|nr:hypothetical protein [Syntrophobacteraceae bacterium]